MSEAIEQWMTDFSLEFDVDGRVTRKIRSSDDFNPPTGIELHHIAAFEESVRADERKLCMADVCVPCERGEEPHFEDGVGWRHGKGASRLTCAAHCIRTRDEKESAK